MHVHVRPAWRGRRREAAMAAPMPEPNGGAHFYTLRFEEDATHRLRFQKGLHSVLK